MSDYYNILTNLGRSKITDLITSDAALENIQIAFGDGNGSVPTPNPARTALVNEVHRRPANKLQKHPTLTNSIIVDVVIPNNVGGFWIREFGIYFDGTLICNGSLAPTFKEASDDTVNTYRLKPYINVESDRLKVVEIESDLINATESWTQENFINRSEIVDNLTTDDATKPISAKQVKKLQDNKLNTSDLKDASTGQKGIIQVASLEEAIAGIEELKAITPATLIALFSSGLNRFSIPNASEPRKPWIIQFGIATEYVQTNFPIAYPNECEVILATLKVNSGENSGAVTTAYILSESKFQLTCGNNNGNVLYWVSIGK